MQASGDQCPAAGVAAPCCHAAWQNNTSSRVLLLALPYAARIPHVGLARAAFTHQPIVAGSSVYEHSLLILPVRIDQWSIVALCTLVSAEIEQRLAAGPCLPGTCGRTEKHQQQETDHHTAIYINSSQIQPCLWGSCKGRPCFREACS